jgi:hypothetical protein
VQLCPPEASKEAPFGGEATLKGELCSRFVNIPEEVACRTSALSCDALWAKSSYVMLL